jgi:hypothetical protein
LGEVTVGAGGEEGDALDCDASPEPATEALLDVAADASADGVAIADTEGAEPVDAEALAFEAGILASGSTGAGP